VVEEGERRVTERERKSYRYLSLTSRVR
jgi:hypothetical protein